MDSKLIEILEFEFLNSNPIFSNLFVEFVKEGRYDLYFNSNKKFDLIGHIEFEIDNYNKILICKSLFIISNEKYIHKGYAFLLILLMEKFGFMKKFKTIVIEQTTEDSSSIFKKIEYLPDSISNNSRFFFNLLNYSSYSKRILKLNKNEFFIQKFLS